MADYILKNVNKELWKKIKKLAVDKEMTIRSLIIHLFKNELKEANKK